MVEEPCHMSCALAAASALKRVSWGTEALEWQPSDRVMRSPLGRIVGFILMLLRSLYVLNIHVIQCLPSTSILAPVRHILFKHHLHSPSAPSPIRPHALRAPTSALPAARSSATPALQRRFWCAESASDEVDAMGCHGSCRGLTVGPVEDPLGPWGSWGSWDFHWETLKNGIMSNTWHIWAIWPLHSIRTFGPVIFEYQTGPSACFGKAEIMDDHSRAR